MDFLESKQESRKEFIDLLKKRDALAPLADSQLITEVNIFQNLALEAGFKKLERVRQEMYLSTCLNRSSTLALAEDRLYIPRKPSPSKGKVRIENKGSSEAGLPDLLKLVDEKQVPYTLTEPVKVKPGQKVEVEAAQMEFASSVFTVSEEKPFLEILLARDLSPNVSDFSVFVDSGSGFEKWEYKPLFRNTKGTDQVYDEFYDAGEQIGIRFGNGLFGKVPPLNAQIKILMWVTRGDVSLMPNQKLTPVMTVPEKLEFHSAGVIAGGREVESTEEIAKNASYNILHDETIVWDDDYEFFSRRKHPSLLWFRVWGEDEMEKMKGKMDIRYINKIYLSCYAPDDPKIGDKVKASLDKTPRLNRSYVLYPPEEHEFTLSISATLKRDVSLEEGRDKISEKLNEKYGKNSYKRVKACLIRDVYAILNKMGIFTAAEDIQVALTGKGEPEFLYQMVYINLEETMKKLKLEY